MWTAIGLALLVARARAQDGPLLSADATADALGHPTDATCGRPLGTPADVCYDRTKTQPLDPPRPPPYPRYIYRGVLGSGNYTWAGAEAVVRIGPFDTRGVTTMTADVVLEGPGAAYDLQGELLAPHGVRGEQVYACAQRVHPTDPEPRTCRLHFQTMVGGTATLLLWSRGAQAYSAAHDNAPVAFAATVYASALVYPYE